MPTADGGGVGDDRGVSFPDSAPACPRNVAKIVDWTVTGIAALLLAVGC